MPASTINLDEAVHLAVTDVPGVKLVELALVVKHESVNALCGFFAD